jgi:hypothetical protein
MSTYKSRTYINEEFPLDAQRYTPRRPRETSRPRDISRPRSISRLRDSSLPRGDNRDIVRSSTEARIEQDNDEIRRMFMYVTNQVPVKVKIVFTNEDRSVEEFNLHPIQFLPGLTGMVAHTELGELQKRFKVVQAERTEARRRAAAREESSSTEKEMQQLREEVKRLQDEMRKKETAPIPSKEKSAEDPYATS